MYLKDREWSIQLRRIDSCHHHDSFMLLLKYVKYFGSNARTRGGGATCRNGAEIKKAKVTMLIHVMIPLLASVLKYAFSVSYNVTLNIYIVAFRL